VLPRYGAVPSPHEPVRIVRGVLAVTAGIGTFLLLAHMASLPVNSELADWFGRASLPEAHGHNVVNVIIVDFRALDTLGEIAVVAFSLLAALPLFAGLRKARSS
jgi:multicomponent Na+:H+ antiporter subunit A